MYIDAGMPQQTEIVPPNGADETPFSLEKSSWSLKSAAQNNKQAAPDHLQRELLKWLKHDDRKMLLNLINMWWCEKTVPHALFQARVVPILTKGKQRMRQIIGPFHY